jgi:MFS family permease
VFSFGVFLKPIAAEFHAGRAAVSLAFTMHNLFSAFSLIFVGRMCDRWGARRVMLLGTLSVGVMLLGGRWLGSSIGWVYLFFALLGLASPMTTPVPYSAVVSRWFDRKRGLALGLTMFGLGLGAMLVPRMVYGWIARFGWRMAFVLFGVTMLVIAFPVLALLVRNDPRELGLLPDGEPAGGGKMAGVRREEAPAVGDAWREVWHSSTFWRVILMFFLVGASVHACVLHMPSLLTDRGATAQEAARATQVVGLALLLGRVCTGYVLDRFFAPKVAMVFFSGALAGMLLLMAGASGRVALGAAFLVGLGMGAEGDVVAYMMGRYFGLKSFGTAFGYAFSAYVLAGAAGTLLMGAGFDLTHAYTLPLAGCATGVAVAIAIVARLGPYRYAATRELEVAVVAPEALASEV